MTRAHTGAANNADETQMRVAVNRVHHAPAQPSWLELPVLRDAGAPR